MIQTVHKTYNNLGNQLQHFISAYDENGDIIDIVEGTEDKGTITFQSIVKNHGNTKSN